MKLLLGCVHQGSPVPKAGLHGCRQGRRGEQATQGVLGLSPEPLQPSPPTSGDGWELAWVCWAVLKPPSTGGCTRCDPGNVGPTSQFPLTRTALEQGFKGQQ